MKKTAKIHYAWVVAGMTFLTLLLGAGVRATPSILLVPLEKEFGWSAATISAAIAVNIFLFGMIGPFAVAVMERFGLRRTVSFSLVILSLGVALTSLMRTPWQMMALWGFIGLLLAAFLASFIGSASKRHLDAEPILERI